MPSLTPQNLTPREGLDKLVSFPTVSDVLNLELIDWVEGYLASHGVRAHRGYFVTFPQLGPTEVIRAWAGMTLAASAFRVFPTDPS